MDLGGAHGGGVPFIMKEDEAPDGLDIAFFGAETELLQACDRTNLVEQGRVGHGAASGRCKHIVLYGIVALIDSSTAVFPTKHHTEAMLA